MTEHPAKSRRVPWTPDEDLRLASRWSDPRPVKMWIDEFPGRTDKSIESRGAYLKLPDRSEIARKYSGALTADRVIDEMKRAPGTVLELSVRLSRSTRTVQRVINSRRPELYIKSYRARGDSGYAPAVWAYGNRKDATRPEREPKKAIASRYYWKTKLHRPDQMAKILARHKLRYAEKVGKLIRRDPLVEALFGKAAA